MTRTFAYAATALRTVPAGRNQCTLLCVQYKCARIPDGTSMQGFDAPVRCDATADVLRTGWHVQVTRVRRNQRVRVLHTAFATQRLRSKVESLRALHQYTNVQRGLALHAAPATLVARPAPGGGTATFVESLRTVRGAKAAAFASAYAALRLQLGVRRSSRCASLHADAMEHAPKPSQRLGQRLYDALRRSKLKFAGRRFHGAIASCSRPKSQLGLFRRGRAWR